MARRRSSAMDFLDAFNAAYGATTKVARDWETSRAMRETPEEATAFTAEQGQGLEQAARQGMQIGWDDAQRAYTSTDPMSGVTQTIAPRTQHTFMGQTSDTAFTPTQISQARYNRLGDIAAKYGDSEGALRLRSGATKMEADDLALTKARRDNTEAERVAAEAETKRNNLTQLNNQITTANEALARGDIGPMQKLFNQTAGMTSLNTDAETPGFLAFDPKTGSVTLASNHPGFPTTTLPAVQWLGYVQRAAASTTTGNAVDGLNSMFTSFLGARKAGEDSAKTAMGLKKDTAQVGYWEGMLKDRETGRQIQAFTAGANTQAGGAGGSRTGAQRSLATITDKDLNDHDLVKIARDDVRAQGLTGDEAFQYIQTAKRRANEMILTDRTTAYVRQRLQTGEDPDALAREMVRSGMAPGMVESMLVRAGAKPGLAAPAEVDGRASRAPVDGDPVAPAVAGRSAPVGEPAPPATRGGLNLPSSAPAAPVGPPTREEQAAYNAEVVEMGEGRRVQFSPAAQRVHDFARSKARAKDDAYLAREQQRALAQSRGLATR